MALESVPTDVIGDDLVRTYRRGTRRLEELVRDALARGLDPDRLGTAGQRPGDATAAYRARQLAKARRIAAELERLGPRVAPIVARRSYAATVFAVDRTVGDAGRLASRFGDVHQRAVQAMAANMSSSLEAAAARAGENVGAVFARMDALEGGVAPSAFPFVGRRVDDPWRKVSLDALGAGLVAGDTRREASRALYRSLIDEGVADATAGFVDRRGARWSLDTYAEMVARTTTREATSRATVNRLVEHGLDLVTISSHPHAADECTPYDGETFAITGRDGTHPELDRLPPFHPRCRHVATPAAAPLEEFERELADAARNDVDVPDVEAPPALRPPSTPGSSPLSEAAEAAISARTPARKEAQDRVDSWQADPGEDPELAAARRAWQDADAKQSAAYDRARTRSDAQAIDAALGPDLVRILDDLAASGYKDASLPELRRALRDGDVTIDYVEELAEAELQARYMRRADRDRAELERGLKRKPIPCFVCGRFKRRPADVCDHCGDDPVSWNPTSREIADFNQAYGYPAEGTRFEGTYGDYQGPIDQRP